MDDLDKIVGMLQPQAPAREDGWFDAAQIAKAHGIKDANKLYRMLVELVKEGKLEAMWVLDQDRHRRIKVWRARDTA